MAKLRGHAKLQSDPAKKRCEQSTLANPPMLNLAHLGIAAGNKQTNTCISFVYMHEAKKSSSFKGHKKAYIKLCAYQQTKQNYKIDPVQSNRSSSIQFNLIASRKS